jgi:peptidoglycan/LPS O-acetylase OafA/YrhL
MEPKANFNLSIHGLRGFAAISVVLFHVHGMGAKNNSLWANIEWLLPIGSFFVCIFFCISGFLIVQTLEKYHSLSIFTRNRLIRIYPVFFLLHLLIFVVGPAKGYDWMGELKYGSSDYFEAFFINLFFLPGIFDLPIAQKNAWSLSYEALFYILAGVVWRTSLMVMSLKKKIILSLEILLILFIIYNFMLASFFLIGVVCYFIQTKYADRVPSTYHLGLPALIVGGIGYTYHPLISFPFVCIFFLEVVQKQGLLAKLLRIRVMGFLGTISYSLYLIHPFAMDIVRTIAVKTAQISPSLGILMMIICGPIVSIGIAWISYELIERKFTKLVLKAGM